RFVAEVTLGVLQDLFAALARRGRVRDTRHVGRFPRLSADRSPELFHPSGVFLIMRALEAERQAALEGRGMARSHQLVATGTTLLLRALRGQQVSEAGRTAHELAFRGKLEALGNGLFGLLHEMSGRTQGTNAGLASGKVTARAGPRTAGPSRPGA